MKKSDIYICGFMYAFSFFFLYLTQSFPLGARHYPHFVIGLLLLLTTVRVGQMVRDYRREKASEEYSSHSAARSNERYCYLSQNDGQCRHWP